MASSDNNDTDNHAQALAALPDDIEVLKAMVLDRNSEIEQLKLFIAKLKRMQFGRSSERLDKEVEQLELRLEELQAQAELDVVRAGASPEKRKPVRQPLPAHLPREQVVYAPDCSCPDCGRPMRQIGEDIAEVLDYVPASFRVIRHVRPKLACPGCEKIVQADAPSRPICNDPAEPAQVRPLKHTLQRVSSYPAPDAVGAGCRSRSSQRSRDWHAARSRIGTDARTAL